MARSRNIKPGYFKNEQLVELPFEYRLLFAGLWTLADRDGYLEDRPKRIKMEIFPADEVSIEDGLRALEKAGLIVRYSVNEIRYLHVCEFLKHQNPHINEAPSIIPKVGARTDALPCVHDASTVQAPCKHDASTQALGLIPDSLNLIPDSLPPSFSDFSNPQKPSIPPSKIPLVGSGCDKKVNQKINGNGKPADDETPVVELIPLNDGTEFEIRQSAVEEFERAYPAVDVPLTLKEIRAWCKSNPEKRKTRRRAMAFVNSWLSREQNEPQAAAH